MRFLNTWLLSRMGKPKAAISKAKTADKNRSNPFAIKRPGKKTKTKKVKSTVELVDRTFSDLQSHCKAQPERGSTKSDFLHKGNERTSKTINTTSLDELVSETTHTRISSS